MVGGEMGWGEWGGEREPWPFMSWLSERCHEFLAPGWFSLSLLSVGRFVGDMERVADEEVEEAGEMIPSRPDPRLASELLVGEVTGVESLEPNDSSSTSTEA